MDTEKLKILLIEDNPGDVRLIKELLAEAPEATFSLEHVDTLSKGLARLAEGGVDVILLDLSLPDSQGLEGLDKILAKTLSVPIVVLSGLSDDVVALKAVQWGAQDYLVKGDTDNNLLVRSIRYSIERQRLRVAVRESEARYRLLADNIADVIWTADSEARITYVSPSIKRFLGYTVEEAMKLKISDILTTDSADQARRFVKWQIGLYARGMQPPPASMTLEHICKDGSMVLAEVMLSFLQGEDGRIVGIMGATRDITERRKAEEALRQSEERYRELFENANDIIYTHDLSGNFTSINNAGERGTGYTRDEVLSMDISSILPSQSLGMAHEMMARKINQGGQTRYELEIIAKDGHHVQLEVSTRLIYEEGKPVGVQGIARDITERKRIEKELRESEERSRTIFEGTSIGIAFVDFGGNIIDINPAFHKMLGYSLEEFRELKNLEYLYPDDAMRDAKLYVDMLKGKHDHYSVDKRYVRKDGQVLWGRQNLSVVRDAEGKPLYFIAMLEDITERKRIEEELCRSEETLRLYFQNVSDVIYSFDTEFRVLNVSPAVERLLGYRPEELIGRLFYELNLVTPASLELTFSDVMRVFEGEHVISSREFIAKDGTIRFGEVSLAPLYSAGGKVIGVLGVGRDITERKRMEEALRQSEKDYRALFDSTIDGMIVIDAETMKVLLINQPIVNKYGSGFLDDIFERNPLDFVHPEDKERVSKLIVEDMFAKDTREMVKFRLINSDGKMFWVSCVGVRISYQGRLAGLVSLRDITEQQEAEELLRQSEHNYRILFESTLDGMVVIDGETMEVMFANQTAAKLSGFDSAQDLIGLNPLDFVAPEERERAFNLIKEEVFERDLHRIHEYRAIDKAGQQLWVSAVSARTEFQGRPAALVSVRDITERKRAEEEKRKLEEQIQLAGRLAAVGELAAGVAHELNNPIAAIKGFAQLLATKEDVDAGTKKDLQTIFRESQRASKITQNLLTFARRHEPEKRFISINEALERTLELRAHQMKLNNIELEEDLDANLPRTMADFYHMEQVFLNIINNAEQAMMEAHGKGKLIVRTRKVGGMIQINFIDDGPGISEENLKRIFDPFFTTKEVGKGTGLGLSICYGLVEAHYGRMYAKSKLGKGATFVVEIPIVSEEQGATESPKLSPGSRGE